VLGLAAVLAGLVTFGPGRDDDGDEVAQINGGGTTTTREVGDTSASTPSTSSPSGGAKATAASTGGGIALPAAAPPSTTQPAGGGGSGSSPRSTTTTSTTAPSTPTTAPAFVAPTTSGARIDGCVRLKNRLRITYSWRFDGGIGWRAPSGYAATGGGRYQDVVDVPRRGNTSITSVQVLDGGGESHAVALQPALQSSDC
jgi:hypothetical protein